MAKKTDRSHSDFYKNLRERIARWADDKKLDPRYRDYILALPDLLHLVTRLMLDVRVDVASKAILGVAAAYALSPFDLLPDVLGPVGFLDDLLVVVVALDLVLDRVPPAIIKQHWAGSGDVLELIRTVLDKADQWVGRGMYRRIRSMVERYRTASGDHDEDVVDGEVVAKRKPRAARSAPKAAAPKRPARKAPARKAPAKKSPAKKKAR